jgi:hypothetical protein
LTKLLTGPKTFENVLLLNHAAHPDSRNASLRWPRAVDLPAGWRRSRDHAHHPRRGDLFRGGVVTVPVRPLPGARPVHSTDAAQALKTAEGFDYASFSKAGRIKSHGENNPLRTDFKNITK